MRYDVNHIQVGVEHAAVGSIIESRTVFVYLGETLEEIDADKTVKLFETRKVKGVLTLAGGGGSAQVAPNVEIGDFTE